jgi:hypothetical protein
VENRRDQGAGGPADRCHSVAGAFPLLGGSLQEQCG